MSIGRCFKPSASPSRAASKSLTCQKIQEGHTDSDSVMVRASDSGAGGRGFDPEPGHTKDLKNGTSGYLAWRSATLHGAQHYKASTGFSSPKTKYSITNIACII